MNDTSTTIVNEKIQLSAVVTLLKPITWFPPMWAYGCGVVSAGGNLNTDSWLIILGILLAGPLVCGTSQAVNDWFDRHVDAINEPERPIPSGRIPGKWGLYISIIWTALSVLLANIMGIWVLLAALFGLTLAWLYSAPPLRFKQNGWIGNSAVAICYEGLPWFTGAAVISATLPDQKIILVALLYSIGAHGIMTLNDFKSVQGDLRMGVRSLPAQLGSDRAAQVACLFMVIPQLVVIYFLQQWQLSNYAMVVATSLIIQVCLMFRLLSDPKKYAPWYNATGISLYVLGMMATAFALRSLGG